MTKQSETSVAPRLSTSMDNLRAEREVLHQDVRVLYQLCKKLKTFNIELKSTEILESEGYPLADQLEREVINFHNLVGDLEQLLTHLGLVI